MTHEEIAEQLYDELQHNRILNREEYDKRLKELGGGEKVENIMHNRWSFGFCDMCDEVIFYDTDSWFDLCGELFENERDNLEERLPKYEKQVGHEIQDVCSVCFHKIVDEKERRITK